MSKENPLVVVAKKKKLTFHTYFDEKYFNFIKQGLTKNELDIISKHYEQKYNSINYNIDKLKDIIDKLKTLNNNVKESFEDKFINLSFFYDSSAPNKRFNKELNLFEINVYAQDESIEKNKEKYIQYIQSRISKEINIYKDTESKKTHIFVGLKDKGIPYIKYEDSIRDVRSKSRTFQSKDLIKYVYESLTNVIKEKENFFLDEEEIILPFWYTIDLNKTDQIEKIKKRLQINDTSLLSIEDIRFAIFAYRFLHKKLNLYEKIESIEESKIKFSKYKVLFKQKESNDYKYKFKKYFSNKGITKKDLRDNIFIVDNIKFKIDLNEYSKIGTNNSININHDVYTNLFLKIKEYRQGTVYYATIINGNSPKSIKKKGIMIMEKMNKINESDEDTLYTTMLIPEMDKKEYEFLYKPNFLFDYFHIERFYENKKIENMNLQIFILNLFTKQTLMTDFYLFCLNDNDYQKVIYSNDVNETNIRSQIEKQINMMIVKKRKFTKKEESKSSERIKYEIKKIEFLEHKKDENEREVKINIFLIILFIKITF